ncbi:MAG: hypothetical protein RLZZ258_840 [Actinomycetota bacterium]|jgi:LPXTG-motif cell wall-anchored protein
MNRKLSKVLAAGATAIALMTMSTTPASALVTDGPAVLVFSNDLCTDELEEDTDIANALREIASAVTVFDGGDGSAAAWTTALTGIDVLTFPEGCNFEEASLFSDDAKTYIKSWIEAGKTVVGTGSYDHAAFINYMTGLDYSAEFNNNDEVDPANPWTRQNDNADLPLTVPNANWAGGLVGFSAWSADKKAFVTPVYYSEVDDNLAVGYFTFGSGYYIYNAYDWYPDSDELTSGVRDAWNQTLQFAATGQIAPPTTEEPAVEPTVQEELADTGVDAVAPFAAGAALLIAGLVVMFARRRQTN